MSSRNKYATASTSPTQNAEHFRAWQELRQKAEVTLRDQGAQSHEKLNPISPEAGQRILHELRLHQIELEMQNEELRRIQTAQDALQARYVALFDLAPVGYCIVGEKGLILQANLAVAALLGAYSGALVQQPITRFICNEDQDIYYLCRKQTMATGEAQSCELRMTKNHTSHFWAYLVVTEAEDVDGQHALRIVVTDVSERRHAEDEMRIAAAAFASQNGMVITDSTGVILRVNPSFTRLTGYSENEAKGQTMALLKSGRHPPLFYQGIWDALKTKGYWQGEIWNKRKNDQIYAEILEITAITAPGRGVIFYVWSFTHFSDNQEAEADIHRLAYYDALTGLPNRRLLHDRLSQALAATARSALYGAIFFIDLDNFKTLNDTRGHDMGDLLLIEVAQRLLTIIREGDTVARLGGDEFVVLLENLEVDIDAAAALAKQLGDTLYAAIDRSFNLRGFEYRCKLSIGVALFNEQDKVEDLFKHADLALYQAKSSGRNALRFFDPAMLAAQNRRSALEIELNHAINNKQLVLYYQPQVNTARQVTSAEALLRWEHPQRGLVSPNDFIPLAEETGLILPIGLWVLETACAQLKIWEKNAHTIDVHLAVNVSPRQFRQPDFVAQVSEALATSGANPARLKLELTEGVVLEDVEGTIEKMQAIKRLGVSFSMDDFGTGYSSLSYLARLPLDQIKIDRSFVSNIPGKRNDETIARTIITMGQALGMNVIAEGVETEEQRGFLEAHGCQAFQGYLFSRPLPLKEFEEFIKPA